MTPERWQEVQALLGAALERPVDERSRFVAGVCSDDEELRREVESLLKHASEGSGFLSTPAAAGASTQGAAGTLVGRTIGSFTIKARLGSGGMGDVYLADDAGLRRPVAIKVLREYGPPTAGGRDRLLREARAAAALNHPNIATIFHVLDSVDADTPPLMVMEYVEGETLSELLKRGPLPLEEALRFAREVADALAAAHKAGVVHRDLKPANLRVNHQRRIKVLDFGLARQLSPAVDTTTMTIERSVPAAALHRIAGTPGYSAPEQALGLTIAPPADIFSLGVVLFEMLTGRRPFPGDDLATTGSAIMAMPTPRVADIVRSIPPFVDALVARMLSKDPMSRPTAADVVADLRPTVSGLGSASLAAVPARRLAPAVAIAATLVIASTAGFVWWRTARAPTAVDRPVIAVLPLTNLSGDSAKDYIGVGIAETLMTSLARVSQVSVISRTGLTDARGNADIRTIARDLGATLVLQGSVQQSGDRLRVTARLLRPDGSVAWAGDTDAAASDLFSLETRLAGSIIAGLPVRVSAAEQQTAVVPGTTNRAALEAYWQGLAFMDRGDRTSIQSAITSLERATALDSRFASAFGALGESYRRQYVFTNDSAWIGKAMTAISNGLAIDPRRTDVRISLATLYTQTGRVAEAVNELRAIVGQSPDNDEAHARLGSALNRMNRPDEALAEYQSAVALRPQYWRHHQAIGNFFYTQRRLPEAVAAFSRVIEIRSDDATTFALRGAAYHAMGDRARARADYERSISLRPNAATYSNMGLLAYEDGRHEDAVRAFSAAIALAPKIAAFHRNLGDAYLRLRRDANARAEYLAAVALAEDALRVDPNEPVALTQLAIYEAKVGRVAEARRHADEAVARNNTNPDVLYRRGVALALVGDTDAAIAALSGAVTRGYSVESLRKDDDLGTLAGAPAFRQLLQSPSAR